jgi:7,8-dihydropterin-6-yl-methyl-4-(beta-D-ribofuranosyl)aminobenzene 5'-phosphate synthase
MKIKVLFDKVAMNEKLRIGWGVSFLADDRILFDTGEKGQWLLENMQAMRIDPENIESIVISHDHDDHTGGLWGMLERKKNVKVYSCPNFSKTFKEKVKSAGAELVETDRFTEIAKDIFITGEIQGSYKGRYMPEQAIAFKTANGISIITGCAHPGILKMIGKVKARFSNEKIYLVLGGFHLKNSDKRAMEIVVEGFKKMGIAKAGPTHCSGDIAEGIFKKFYGKDFVSIKVGQEIEV